jgi:hypothetical protein
MGIVVIFLPAYTPFYNPIEFVFSAVKAKMQRFYVEGSKKDLNVFIGEVMEEFRYKDMLKLFEKCGYIGNSMFDPGCGFSNANVGGYQSLE